MRITLKAGKQAVERSQHEYRLLSESADAFSVNPEELPQTSARFFKEWKGQAKTINKLSRKLAEARVPNLISSAKQITKDEKTVRLVITSLDAPQADLINLGEQFSQLSEKTGDLIAVILGNHDGRAMVVAAKSKGSPYKLAGIIRDVGKILGGGGGGKGDVVAGGGTKVENIQIALKQLEKIVTENL
ncbi:MAG: DHHA1 domain-containing protein [Candidatus Kariarchaeaceae archaeon]